MTSNKTPEGRLQVGDVIHFVESGLTSWGRVWSRGDSVQLTAEQIEDSLDRLGRSWLDQIDTEGAKFARGEWPAGTPTWRHGDVHWDEAREQARKLAWAILDPAERAEALQSVETVYGSGPSTSRTLNAAPAAQQRPSGTVGR